MNKLEEQLLRLNRLHILNGNEVLYVYRTTYDTRKLYGFQYTPREDRSLKDYEKNYRQRVD